MRIGWAYVISMLCLNVSAMAIYNLTGRFNLFHALALVSLVMVLAGVAQVVYRGRIRNWLWRHYQYMCWSYVGLLAATCNEAFVRVPPLGRVNTSVGSWLPVLASALIVIAAAVAIVANQRRLLAMFGDPRPS